jgi:ppGpp synthetase/RelA/SpoT-type nucleotidyltranferase
VYKDLGHKVERLFIEHLACVKCLITSREKPVASLESSIIRRQKEREALGLYQDEEDIRKEMIDLAGVRIALYFLDDLEQVRKFIHGNFEEVDEPVVWASNESVDVVTKQPEGPFTGYKASNESDGVETKQLERRFIGYKATHFRVKLKESCCGCRTEEEFKGKIVEIQVMSVFMQAWSGVAHDIIYKPYNGEAGNEVKRILDVINGLALVGEVALEQLQALQKERTRDREMPFEDHFESDACLKKYAVTRFQTPLNDHAPRIERPKLLLEVLRALRVDTLNRFEECLKYHESEETIVNSEKTIINSARKTILSVLRDKSKGLGGVDLSCWAILEVIASKIKKERIPIKETSCKAAIMINSNNLQLSLKGDTTEPYILDSSATGISDWMSGLLTPPSGSSTEQPTNITDMNNLWDIYESNLLEIVKQPSDELSAPYNPQLLKVVSYTISLLGIVVAPHTVPNELSQAATSPETPNDQSPHHRSTRRSLEWKNGFDSSKLGDYVYELLSPSKQKRIRQATLKGEILWNYAKISFDKIIGKQQSAHSTGESSTRKRKRDSRGS